MSRRSTLPQVWLDLAHAVGGVGELAKACGVDKKTVWRWGNGACMPGDITRRFIDSLARRRHLTPPWNGA